jgi:hypothetical protein
VASVATAHRCDITVPHLRLPPKRSPALRTPTSKRHGARLLIPASCCCCWSHEPIDDAGASIFSFSLAVKAFCVTISESSQPWGNRVALICDAATLCKYRAQSPATRRTAVVVGGGVVSLFLHGLLLTPFLWGGHPQRQRTPNAQGSSASQHEMKTRESMMVVFVDDSRAIRDPSQDEGMPSTRFRVPQAPIVPIARPRLSAADVKLSEEKDDRTAPEASGDQTGRSLLFGRYMGQISARVDRAWMRPRSIPAEGSFACRVQITQDQHGNVEEVTLQKCTDDPQWQVSLVRAISAASPLPAPPDPAVFSNLLTVEFDSDPYVAGAGDQGFEPPLPGSGSLTLRHDADSASSSPTIGLVSRRTRADGSVDLKITGPSDRGALAR